MLTAILLVIVGLVTTASVGVCCAIRIVPAKRLRFVVNDFTQVKRTLKGGMNWAYPWESSVGIALPMGDRVQVFEDLVPDATYRYDPKPYRAMTQDQVTVFIDLSIEYKIHNLEAVVDVPTANYMAMLDDEVRARTIAVAAEIPRGSIRALEIGERLEKQPWKKHHGITVTHVIVQDVSFTADTAALLLAKSVGLSPQQQAAHEERMALHAAVRDNPGAQVVLTGAGTGNVLVAPSGGTRKRGRHTDYGESDS